MPQDISSPTPTTYRLEPTQTNTWAISSFLAGCLSILIPIIGGLVAIALGIVGLRRAKETDKGKGLSLTGICLGVSTMVIWLLVLSVYLVGRLMFAAPAPQDATVQFIQNLSRPNVAAAMAQTDGTISETDVHHLTQRMRVWGGFGKILLDNSKAEHSHAVVRGTVIFAKATRAFDASLVKVHGDWKIHGLDLADPQGQPLIRLGSQE